MIGRFVLAAVLFALSGCGEQRIAMEPEPAAAASARGRLRNLHAEDGRFVAEIENRTSPAVELYLATREFPLSYRGPVVHERVAAWVAPGLVPETTLAAVPLGELSSAAREPRARERLSGTLRVLADGRVRAAIVAAPPAGLSALDLTDETSGGLVHSWESALVRRDPPAPRLRAGLAAYQALLVVDYLVSNQARQAVLVDGDGSRLIAARGNDAFTFRPVAAALADPLSRLARHVTYSAALVERLQGLDRDRLVFALSGRRGEGLLVTPKELEQILERKRGLEKLIAGLIRTRGEKKALALP